MNDFPNIENLRINLATSDWKKAIVNYQYDNYIWDLMKVWENAAYPEVLQQIEAGNEPTALAECLRYALIRTCFNTAAGNFPPELFNQAVEKGVWRPELALSIASIIPKDVLREDKKAKLYAMLLATDKLSTEQRDLAQKSGLEEVFNIYDEGFRSYALVALIPHLDESYLAQAFEVVFDLNKWERSYVLVKTGYRLDEQIKLELMNSGMNMSFGSYLGPYWLSNTLYLLMGQLENGAKEKLVTEILNKIPSITDLVLRCETLSILAEYLDGGLKAEVLTNGLEIAAKIEVERDKSRALVKLAKNLSGEMLNQCLKAASDFEDYWEQSRVLAVLVGKMEGKARETAIEQALEAASIRKNPLYQSAILVDLAQALEGEQLAQALEIALEIKAKGCRWDALTALAGKLEGDLLLKALGSALIMKSREDLIRNLDEALNFSREISVEPIPQYESEPQIKILQQELNIIQQMRSEWDQGIKLSKLAMQLKGELLQTGLEIALNIQYEAARVRALKAFAKNSNLNEHGLLQIEGNAFSMDAPYHRAQILATLLPHLPDHQMVLLKQIRQDIAAHLFQLRDETCETVLEFLTHQEIFTPPILGPQTLVQMAEHIKEIR